MVMVVGHNIQEAPLFMKAAQKWAYICRHIFPDVLHVLSASGCRLYLGLRGGCNVEMPEFELFHLHIFLN